MERERFTDNAEAVHDIGIVKLISENVYTAAYPLHDVSYHVHIVFRIECVTNLQ